MPAKRHVVAMFLRRRWMDGGVVEERDVECTSGFDVSDGDTKILISCKYHSNPHLL